MTARPGISAARTIDLAARLTALWGRTIDAPLEKLVMDDCKEEVDELWEELRWLIQPSSTEEVLAAIRMVAVGLGSEPPLGAQLKIYQKLLRELPIPVLLRASEQILAEYKYPTFPKPAEWMERGKEGKGLLAKAELMMKIYPMRRSLAFKKYGRSH